MDDSLACEHIVFRAMLRAAWVGPNGTILPGAFVRRKAPQDDDGLSVDVESPTSCASGFRKCYGVASLHVGRVRTLGLDIVIDAAPHANITGVPRQEEDPAKAERFASQLAKQSRLVPPDTPRPPTS
jgi:hypothetical protein